MNRAWKRLGVISLICLLAVFVGTGVTKAAAEGDNAYRARADEMTPLAGIPKNYSSLAGLVAMVCDDAIKQFQDFFGPAEVVVEPFVILGEFPPQRISLLGATVADQMAAMINNYSVGRYVPEGYGGHAQKVQGILQEIDGLLRIHISGANSAGEWRSYVINVEMSEPIYRAMHTYVGQ